MDIWVKTPDSALVNISVSSGIGISNFENLSLERHYYVFFNSNGKPYDRTYYSSEQRCKEVIQLIQDHINAIGTNNFNNLPMVYVMPIE